MPRRKTQKSATVTKSDQEPQPAKRRGRRAQSGFAQLVSQERKRLERIRDKMMAQKTSIDRELESVQRDLAAIGGFFSKGGSASSFGGRRAGRGQRRQQVLDAIKSFAEGATRGDIIKKLGAAEKSAQQSVSNALNALFKSKAVKREDGRYRAS